MKYVIICLIALCTGFFGAEAAATQSAETNFVAPKTTTKTVTFNVKLNCKNCVNKVKENISYEKGVKDLEVSLEKQTVKVTYDPSKTNEQTLAAAIAKLGYKVSSCDE